MSIIDLIVENRHDILKTCARYGATNVRIFGSCARTDYTDKSDIDVLVNLPRDIRGFNYIDRLCDLEEDLAKLLGVDVDVVDEAAVKGPARYRVLNEAVAL